MSVQSAVTRALRSGGVVSPNEYQNIYSEVLPHIDIAQLEQDSYLINAEDARELRRMVFRNPEEERSFYVGLLYQSRQRVLGQILNRVASLPRLELNSTFICHEGEGESQVEASCYREDEGVISLRPNERGEHLFSNPLLAFLGRILPANSFIGLSAEGAQGELTSIQLLDGVFFTADNYEDLATARETQISIASLRALLRTEISNP